MAKLWATLAALLGLLSVVMAQNASTTVASILPATTTSMPPSPTPTPSSSSSPPSPSPTPNPHPEESFYVRNKEGMVCAHVESTFTFSIKYSVDGKDRSVDISLNSTFVPHVDTDESKCEKSRIVMAVKFNTSEADHFLYLEFTNKSKEYSLASLNASLDLSDNKTFPDFNTTGTSGAVNVSYDEKVFTVDNKKSYKCKSGKSYRLKPEETVPDLKSVYLRTYQFRAQAFKFSNDTTGDFDKSVSCSLDQKSSKVVPIAVGAALAGLVIVVLIAYLIGRFRSRKQNSYEALS